MGRELTALVISLIAHVLLLAGLALSQYDPAIPDTIRLNIIPLIADVPEVIPEPEDVAEIGTHRPEQNFEDINRDVSSPADDIEDAEPVVPQVNDTDPSGLPAENHETGESGPSVDGAGDSSGESVVDSNPPSDAETEIPADNGAPGEEEDAVETGIDLDAIRSDYSSRVLAAISTNKVYPAPARRLNQEGNVTVRFTVSSGGVVTNVVVEESSGFQSLDNAAVNAVSASSPVPPIPTELGVDVLMLSLLIIFDLD